MFKKDSPLARLQEKVITRDQVRSVDQMAMEQFHMNSLVLMENAGLECTKWLESNFELPPKTIVLCGHGNNGGDGLVIHRQLLARGWQCRAVVSKSLSSLSADAAANACICLVEDDSQIVFEPEVELVQQWIGESELILDAMLGTGATGDPREPLSSWIDFANCASGVRVAIDCPTGIDVETGVRANRWFQADHTLTFVARKPAMILSNAAESFGEIHVLPIGTPRGLIAKFIG